MSTITSANSSFALAITNLYPTPQKIEGYAADAMFAFEDVTLAQTIMGVDGKLSAGYVFNEQKQTVTIMPDSDSLEVFSNWYTAQRTAKDIYTATGTIIMPSIGKKFTLKKGILTNGKPMPDAKKVLQAQEYKITWENVTSENYSG